MSSHLPTIQEVYGAAPTMVLTLIVVSFGFYAGWKVRGEVVKTLREWLDTLKRDK